MHNAKNEQFYDTLAYIKTITLDPVGKKLVGPFQNLMNVSFYGEYSRMKPPVFKDEDFKDIELLNEEAFMKYIKILTLYSRHGHKLPQDFLDLIAKRLEKTAFKCEKDEMLSDLNEIFTVNPSFNIKETIYRKIRGLSKENLKKWHLGNIVNLLKLLVKVYSPGDKVETSNGKDLFALLQLLLPEILINEAPNSINVITDIITSYLDLGKGSGNFYVLLEKLLVNNFNKVNEPVFLKIITAYKHRICPDHDYVVNNLLIPFTEKTATFISFIKFKHTSSILYSLCNIFNRYGSCYSESIEISIKKSMKESYLRMTYPEATTYLLTVLAYSSNVRFLDEHLVMQVYQHYKNIYENLKDEHLINFAYYFCRFFQIPDAFWENVSDSMSRADKLNLTYQGMIQSTLIKLKVVNPFAQSLLYKKLPEGFAKEMDELLKIGRIAIAMNSKKSLEHALTEEVLTELEVKFVSEYFQVYCIDIAIPEWKIGFEVCGPSHFVWPSGAINGKTLYKQEILSLLKWKIHVIRFSPSADLVKRKKEIKKEIYEILTQAKLIVKQPIEF